MDERLKELFFDEQDRGRLVFEDCPAYNDLMEQCLALFPGGDLPDPIFQLLDLSNSLSFAHGIGLGLELSRWAAR